MLYALCIDILYKQLINRTFIERDKKLINKKIKKRLSNQQNINRTYKKKINKKIKKKVSN